MQAWLLAAAVFLLLNLAAGLWRVWRGPSAADRMLSALLFGSTTVALLLLLAEAMALPALRDVALLFALLAAIISVAFVSLRAGAGAAGDGDAGDGGGGDGDGNGDADGDGARAAAGERR